jgi:hypothetical protein
MDLKYGSLWGGWCSLHPARAFGVGLWKNRRKDWEKFLGCTRFEVGDGTRISFWHDLWCRDMVPKVAYPVLFGMDFAKVALLLV